MAFNFVVAGSASAVRQAVSLFPADVAGVVLIGDGVADSMNVIARAASWRELDLALLPSSALVLTETPDQPDLRRLFRDAFTMSRTLKVLEGGQFRALKIEDLAGKQSRTDWARIASALDGKRVLVTGGGGSIGAELVRKILAISPAHVSVLDKSEFNLFRVGSEFQDVRLVLADIRDAGAVRRCIEREGPDIVFHAAALKQVPMAESFPGEAVLTNVAGLRNVAEATRAIGADLIFVSTDKAVDPTGVMGATKRLGELYCRALDRRGAERALTVRLGNVIGSAGSVVPLFGSQIAARQPLTLTHASATRFFISISNAAEALLQSAAAGLDRAHDRGLVMAVDMGAPVSILELAKDMIMLAGLRPQQDVEIRLTGLRPGERLHESFVGADEWRGPDADAGVFSVDAAPRGLGTLLETMERLTLLARGGHDAELRAELFAAVAPAAGARTAASPACA